MLALDSRYCDRWGREPPGGCVPRRVPGMRRGMGLEAAAEED